MMLNSLYCLRYKIVAVLVFLALLFIGVASVRPYVNVLAVIIAAVALILAIARANWPRIVRIIVLAAGGAFVGELLSSHGEPEIVIPGAIAGAVIGLVLSRQGRKE